jgi:hypothetical protein
MQTIVAEAAAWAEADAATVVLVLDTQFGERLRALPAAAPAWVAASDLNTPVAHHIRRHSSRLPHAGLTTFTYLATCDLIDFFESLLITIHDHHGPSSQQHGYASLLVIGLPFGPQVAEILADNGLQLHCLTASGFVAKRTSEA